MKYGRTFNFSAGPAMMPEPVLEEIRDEMMNYRGSGMCVMEMSHRSKVFQQIIDEAEADLRELMNIPDNYKVLFIQGGATLQFAAVAWNLMKNGKAVYIETGAWSKKAIAEAKKYGEVIVAASSKDKNYSYIPDCSDLDIPEDTSIIVVKVEKYGTDEPLCREKMVPLAVHIECGDVEEAIRIAKANLMMEGAGHSSVIHTNDNALVERAACELPVSRMLVNCPGVFSANPALANGLCPTATLGCGSWAGCSVSQNLGFEELINVSRIAYVYPENEVPTHDTVWNGDAAF